MKFPEQGRLRNLRLPVLLRLLGREQRTGLLYLRRNDQERALYLSSGDVVFATSEYPDDRLGERLLKTGRITLAQYERSAELLQKGKRQGAILVEQGFISSKELVAAVTDQVREIALSVFTWFDGEYRFEGRALSSNEVIALRISSGDLILQGIRRIADWSRLCSEIPRLDAVLEKADDPRNLYQTVHLSKEERALAAAVDGRATIRELFARSQLPPLHTLQIIHFLLSVGMVVEQGAISIGDEKFVPQQAVEPKAGTIEEPVPEPAVADRARIENAFHLLGRQDHYQVLHVSRQATREEVRKAYFRLAKEYHPDLHFQDGLEDLKPKLEALFARITQAYDVLAMEKMRQEYDMTLAMAMGSPSATAAKETTVEGDQVRAKVQYRRGAEALRRGDLQQAVVCLEWAIRLAPREAAYYDLLGQAFTRISGKLREAEEAFKKAIELDPARAAHYVGLGLVYKRAGVLQRAIRQFEEALRWDPDCRQARDELARLNVKLQAG